MAMMAISLNCIDNYSVPSIISAQEDPGARNQGAVTKKTLMKQCFQKRAQNAFTLVELMVVITTVALLAGLTLPALARARIKAPGEQCISNKRQLMIGWEMYKE